MNPSKAPIFIALFIVFLIGGIIADCSCGRDRHLECNLRRHQYVAPWVETTTSTDSEGHVSFSTIHHPEEFHLIFWDLEENNGIDIEVPEDQYQRMTDGQYATVKVRQGRWTKTRLMPTIIEQ